MDEQEQRESPSIWMQHHIFQFEYGGGRIKVSFIDIPDGQRYVSVARKPHENPPGRTQVFKMMLDTGITSPTR